MKKVLFLVEDLYEDLELWYPKIRLDEAGYKTVVAGPEAGHEYKGKHGYPCKADISFKSLSTGSYEGVVIPGGYAPDKMRRSKEAVACVKKLFAKGKLIAFICHAGWMPISADILHGKRATSYSAIKDDMVNAGAKWIDKEVVVDGNLISSRSPQDLPYFSKAILKFLE